MKSVAVGPRINVLVVCTANLIRSPLAAAMLSLALKRAGVDARVSSAGTRATSGRAPLEVTRKVAATYGLDLSGVSSRPLRVEDIAEADLVLTMAREHLRAVVALAPSSYERAFTLRELVRLAEVAPRRKAPLWYWLEWLSSTRQRSDMMGAWSGDDVADPVAGGLSECIGCAAELDGLVKRLVELTWTDQYLATEQGVQD